MRQRQKLTASTATGMTIDAAVVKFVSDKKAQGVKKGSLRNYVDAINDLKSSCKKTEFEAINQDDMWDFMRWMRVSLKTKRRQRGLEHDDPEPVTKPGCVLCALWQDASFADKDVAQNLEEKSRPRSAIETIDKMLKAATEDEKDLIWFFYCTGFPR